MKEKIMYSFFEMQRELFEVPDDMLATQHYIHKKVSNFFGVSKPVTGACIEPNLRGSDILGAYDPLNVRIIYNPKVLEYPSLRREVAKHEAVHSAQPGLENLLRLYAVYIEDGKVKYVVPLGRAIVEGSTELILEKVGESRIGAYENEYRMVKELDKKIPIKYLHELAESDPQKLLEILNQPDVKRIIENYVFENYVSSMYS